MADKRLGELKEDAKITLACVKGFYKFNALKKAKAINELLQVEINPAELTDLSKDNLIDLVAARLRAKDPCEKCKGLGFLGHKSRVCPDCGGSMLYKIKKGGG